MWHIHIPHKRSLHAQGYQLDSGNTGYFGTHNAFELPATGRAKLNKFLHKLKMYQIKQIYHKILQVSISDKIADHIP